MSYEVPKGLQDRKWYSRGYHGSPKAQFLRRFIQRYLGFGIAIPLRRSGFRQQTPAPLYVEMRGGSERILVRGRDPHDAGDYLLAVEIVNKLVQG